MSPGFRQDPPPIDDPSIDDAERWLTIIDARRYPEIPRIARIPMTMTMTMIHAENDDLKHLRPGDVVTGTGRVTGQDTIHWSEVKLTKPTLRVGDEVKWFDKSRASAFPADSWVFGTVLAVNVEDDHTYVWVKERGKWPRLTKEAGELTRLEPTKAIMPARVPIEDTYAKSIPPSKKVPIEDPYVKPMVPYDHPFAKTPVPDNRPSLDPVAAAEDGE